MTIAAVLFLVVPQCFADDLGDGLAAYDRGDYQSALEEWKKAAAVGEAAAMNAIAGLYDQGYGVGRDRAMAAKWYRRSAERGNAVGQLNLGDMYSRGAGVPLDRSEAYVWLSLAAAQGNAWSADKKLKIAAAMTTGNIAAAKLRYEALKNRLPISP
jgi:uncharacterized protein